MKVLDRLRRIFTGGSESAHERLREESTAYGAAPSDGASQRTVSNDYTELRSGNVLCPSCKGTGLIPRELEETLVALIPLNDDRLKPKRTVWWVLLGIAIVLVIAFIVVFMLIPRAVDIMANQSAIDLVHVVEHSAMPDPKVKFHFLNYVHVANHNYYSVSVVNTSAQVICKFQPWNSEEIGQGKNLTTFNIGPLSTDGNRLYFNNSVEITGVAAEYCQAPFSKLTSLYINMQFNVIALFEYFNHREQVTISMTQQVCCVPSGNCTSR
ncbi:unnamed protein product, partial [Mesorhabditis spiculigera]